MQYYGYKGLLLLFKALIGLKRLVVYLGQGLGRGVGKVGTLYRYFIGFRLYKIGFLFEKKTAPFNNRWLGQLFAFLESRGALQGIVLIFLFLLIYPQTRLYSKEPESVVGRETILYKMVGPGDEAQIFSEVEVAVAPPLIAPGRRWNEGAVTAEPSGSPGESSGAAPEQIAGISAGGSALTKPTIISGNEGTTLVGQRRTSVTEYEVKPGDTIGQIAAQFDLRLATLLWSNGLTERSYIRPGDRLKILPVDGVLHKVVRGDTVGKIAKQYQAASGDIISFNKLQKDGSDIVVGEILIVPGGQLSRPVPATVAVRPSSRFQQIVAPPSITVPAGLGYLWPTAVRRITQYFGWRHTGLDVAGPLGTPIYAARAGKVTTSKCVRGGYGCHIIIDHGDGIHTLYGHASKMFVAVGEAVTQGQTIALMGSTGRSTGPHVHFEVRIGGKRQNPLKYVR